MFTWTWLGSEWVAVSFGLLPQTGAEEGCWLRESVLPQESVLQCFGVPLLENCAGPLPTGPVSVWAGAGQGQGQGPLCMICGCACFCPQDYMSLCLCGAGEGWKVGQLWRLCCACELVLGLCACLSAIPPHPHQSRACRTILVWSGLSSLYEGVVCVSRGSGLC